MNASFRISLLYLLLIIPQHRNSPLPVMESWLQKDQDDGFVQRDMTSSLTGGDESFGSAHQTYQNSLIRKKKADTSGNALTAPGYRKFSAKFDRSQGYDPPNLFFNGRYVNNDYNPLGVDPDRDGAVFEDFDSNPAMTANKYHSRTSNLGNLKDENLNPRMLNKYKDDKNMALFGNRMNSFRGDGLTPLNDDVGRSAKWSLCKRLKQRYAPNPLLAFPAAAEDRSNFNCNENGPVQNGYLIMDNERRNRAIRNQEYREAGRPDGKGPQIFGENEYYDMEENPGTGEDDLNVEDEDYNQVLNGHSYMHKREERNQQPYNQKSNEAQVVLDALSSRDSTKGFTDDSTLLGAIPGGLTHIRMPKTRNINNMPDAKLTWKLNSDFQSRALSDVVKDSQKALQEVQLFQQKLSYKSPEGSENEGSKRESRHEPQMKLDKKNLEFDEKRLKREDEDEQKNMKTGTDEGGGGEYEDEEGKGHKDEEEYYEDADLSDEDSGNEIQMTDRLNQKYVKREVAADHLKKSKEKEADISQDYELNLENAPVENAAKSRKSSYREDMLEDVVNDYAKYLKVDLQNEFRDVQDTIDDMLTRLDEFENLINMVKIDNELCADISIPIVLHSKKKLDLLCDQIDALEKVVSCAKSDIDLIEMQVEEAEEVLSSQPSGKLKNIFKPFFFKKSPNEVPMRRHSKTLATYEAPALFTTSSFFPSQNEEALQEKQNAS